MENERIDDSHIKETFYPVSYFDIFREDFAPRCSVLSRATYDIHGELPPPPFTEPKHYILQGSISGHRCSVLVMFTGFSSHVKVIGFHLMYVIQAHSMIRLLYLFYRWPCLWGGSPDPPQGLISHIYRI